LFQQGWPDGDDRDAIVKTFKFNGFCGMRFAWMTRAAIWRKVITHPREETSINKVIVTRQQHDVDPA